MPSTVPNPSCAVPLHVYTEELQGSWEEYLSQKHEAGVEAPAITYLLTLDMCGVIMTPM